MWLIGGVIKLLLDDGTVVMFGLASGGGTANFNTINYAAYLVNNTLYAFANGVQEAYLGQIQKGDRISVRRINGKVYVSVNGDFRHTFAAASTTSLLVDVSLSAGSLSNVRASFGADKTLASTLRWLSVANLSIASNTLTKTAPNSWNGIASSMNVLSGDGWMEFKTNELNTHRFAGLASLTPIGTYNDLDYSIHLTLNGAFDIWENGKVVYTPPVNKKYKAGDIFKIVSHGGLVDYYLGSEWLCRFRPH